MTCPPIRPLPPATPDTSRRVQRVTLSTNDSGPDHGPPGDPSIPDGRSLRALRLHYEAQGSLSMEEVAVHLLSVIAQLRELTTKMEETVRKSGSGVLSS